MAPLLFESVFVVDLPSTFSWFRNHHAFALSLMTCYSDIHFFVPKYETEYPHHLQWMSKKLRKWIRFVFRMIPIECVLQRLPPDPAYERIKWVSEWVSVSMFILEILVSRKWKISPPLHKQQCVPPFSPDTIKFAIACVPLWIPLLWTFIWLFIWINESTRLTPWNVSKVTSDPPYSERENWKNGCLLEQVKSAKCV